MKGDHLRPIDTDPGREHVAGILDAGEEWWLSGGGEPCAFGVEAMQADGSAYQRLVAVTWPSRRNGTDEVEVLRVLMDPADAMNLARMLIQAYSWLVAEAALNAEGGPA